MILKKAREYASDFAEQSVDAAVITVPPYFTQSERRAIKRACELANIKLLQLMNDNTAVALNYGIFRRKDFNASGSTYLFYDMGSQSTVCTIAIFNVVKSKENGYLEDVPQLTIKSVAFDRDLGGLEFQIRLRDYLANKFHEQHPKIDLFKNPKALTKLFHEAEKAKHVLSANIEYTAQVEGLINEIDFKHRITREKFESLCVDLFERVKRPIEEVLNTSGVTLVRQYSLTFSRIICVFRMKFNKYFYSVVQHVFHAFKMN
jgi:hypoxia up-regulated 1